MIPCYCDLETIYCGGNDAINLKRILQRYSAAIDDEKKKYFKKFFLNSTANDELQEYTFEDIMFEEINLHEASNLSRIHTHAFSASSKSIKQFVTDGSPINYSLPNYDIFAALSLMNELHYIEILSSKIFEIPENAFRSLIGLQKNLNFINFSSLEKIGKNAFHYLPNLTDFLFDLNRLDFIPENAFNLLKESDIPLNLDLGHNQLNSSSFHVSAFDNIKRPVKLILNYNKITYLDKHIFEPLLNQNKINKLSINTIDCDNCCNFWLINDNFYEIKVQLIEWF